MSKYSLISEAILLCYPVANLQHPQVTVTPWILYCHDVLTEESNGEAHSLIL